MQFKISLKHPGFIIIVVAIIFFLISFLFLNFYLFGHVSKKLFLQVSIQDPKNFVASNSTKPIKIFSLGQIKSSGLPVLLKIPEISVKAKINSVGVTSTGAVGVPKGLLDAAWFNLGPRPGENGSAVIVGHYGQWKNGDEPVFNNLNKLIPGDRIYVVDDKGATNIFIVRALRTYGQNEYAPEVFNSGDERAHLNLITCEGAWIVSQKTYSNRLVVFADKE